MKKLLTIIVGILSLLSSTYLKSQDTCGLAQAMYSMFQADLNYQSNLNSFESNYRQDALTRDLNNVSDERIIPVVFHIFHNNGPENISNTKVLEALDQMNAQFAGMEGGTNTKIRFKLATIDPNGNCTNGIVRIQTSNPKIILPGSSAAEINIEKAFKN